MDKNMTRFSLPGVAAICATLLFASVTPAAAADEMEIEAASFGCLTDMTRVRGFYVDNLLGNLEATLAAANSAQGGVYPPGSLVQLVPSEVMVKRRAGWSPATKDWEFFELDVSAEGSSIRGRGTSDVVNRFGGNCLDCHALAEPRWDMICETGHGCAPIPVTREQITAIQQADPRCVAAAATED
jgi:hypothetical protein